MRGGIRTDRRIQIPEKIAFAGGNTWITVFKYNEQMVWNTAGLTRQVLSLRTSLLERASSTLTTGPSHLNNLVSPLLNSSNSRACSWNISRIESGPSQLSILSASG